MAEITRQRRGELVRGLFALLREHPEGMQAALALRALAERVPPTPFEMSTYPKSPTVRRYEKIVRFSTIPAVKAGWLVKDKGQWSLTDDGIRALEQYADPEQFTIEARRLYRAWAKDRPAVEQADSDDVEDETVETASTLEEAEETAWAEIREFVSVMPPYDFQALVGSLLKAMGYYVLWDAPPGPDRGIDLIAHNDPLGTTNPRIVVQVKRYGTNKVTSDALRSFLAVLGDKDVGIFICPGGFTSDAEREARTQERRRLTLIDLNKFVALWIEHSHKLGDAERQRLPLKPVYFLASET
jgi:restriction system protein